MAIDARTKQILWGKSGAHCAFPGCRRHLVKDKETNDRDVIVGEIAHIVGQSKDGPRGHMQIPGGNIDGYENLILLCHEHHELVDQQPNTYSIEKLTQYKVDHEMWVQTRLSKDQSFVDLKKADHYVKESVFSNILIVSQIPHFIYFGPCTVAAEGVKELIAWPSDKRIQTPYIVQGDQLYTFCDLSSESSPFAKIVDPFSAARSHLNDWRNDPDKMRWYMQLLNRTINKIAGRLGLKLDKDHHRYFFEPDEPGVDLKISYQSVGGVKSERSVAWNPHFKHDGTSKSHWEHLAVGLRFHRLSDAAWGLSIRPERRFTSDGFQSLDGKNVGKKSTKRKSRMYNFDVLKEIQFWRDFLSKGGPRIVCLFGNQSLIIENSLVQSSISWPAIAGDQADKMHAEYEEDLFSLADLNEASDFSEFDDDLENVESGTEDEDR